MKRLSAILLLVCLAVYQFGYFAVEYWGSKHIDKKWSEKIYSEAVDYSNMELIKVPLSVPYMPDDKEFKVVNNSYEQEGKFYRVLEQRYRNDTLEMRVVADNYKLALKSVINEWISTTDAESPLDAVGKIQAKFISKEFNFNKSLFGERPFNGLLEATKAIEYNHFYTAPKLDVPTEPPCKA